MEERALQPRLTRLNSKEDDDRYFIIHVEYTFVIYIFFLVRCCLNEMNRLFCISFKLVVYV